MINQIEKLKREGKEYGKNRSKKRKERKKERLKRNRKRVSKRRIVCKNQHGEKKKEKEW